MHCDFTELAAPGLRSLQPYRPGKPESELRRELGLGRILKLASNESPLEPSPRVLAAVQEASPGLARYPDGNGFALKRQLARHHGVPMDCITLGNGSNDVLDMVARAFLTPRSNAVFANHAFAIYPIVTLACGASPRSATANPADHAMPHGHDLASMRACIDADTRVVFIANPNNPTGTWLAGDAVEAFLKNIPTSCLVVLDEAYFEYVDEPDYSSALPWLERFPNLIVTRTFSKAYGLAGLRMGYGISHPQVAELLNRVRQPFNVNALALVAAEAALADGDHLQRTIAINRNGMRQLRAALDALGIRYLPSAGNFLCVNTGRPGQEIVAALLRYGVIVRPVENYGLHHFLRITVGTEEQNTVLLEALAKVMEV